VASGSSQTGGTEADRNLSRFFSERERIRRRHESLSSALERELVGEIGPSVLSSQLVDPFDRPEKEALCALFRTIIKGNKAQIGRRRN
jgi:hypothetical protein